MAERYLDLRRGPGNCISVYVSVWHCLCVVQAVAPRLSWVAGDFFGPPGTLPDGDLVVLGRILHDWEEARGMKLLRTIYDKLPVGVWGSLGVSQLAA
jgi:hypothetical protein